MRRSLSNTDRAAWAKLWKMEGQVWKYPLVAAVTLGGTGLVVGCLAPLQLNPDSNLGPVVGILFTGPCAAALGIILGFLSSKLRLSPVAFLICLVLAAIGVSVATVNLSRPDVVIERRP